MVGTNTSPMNYLRNFIPVFISHSHQDKDFVDKLAGQLVMHIAYVWLDRWETKVGDSLLGKVQAGIKSASALLIILSKASVASEWCKKELHAGLMRELQEKRVVVLPLLLADCDIPVFLKEKKYQISAKISMPDFVRPS